TSSIRENEHRYVCKLPDSLNHQYSHRTPVECTLTTREGRRYIVTLRGNRFRVFFDEGWRDFVHGEDIMVDNCLWFDRTSFTDFIVTMHGEDQVERDLRYRYTLEIKKRHVERARLSIPINFWRDYILTDPTDTFRAILEFERCTYELQIVQGHGNILMQNWDAEDFVDATQMVEGDTWQFTLTPYFCVRFESKRCRRGRKWIGGLKHEGSFLWDDDSNWYFSSRGSAQTYCNTQSNAEGSSHTTRGSNFSTTSHAPTNNDSQSVFIIATADIVRKHFHYIREGFSNKWLPAAEDSFCSILLHYIQSEGLNYEFDIYMAFDRIHRSCLGEIGHNLTLAECYTTFMVLKERYRTFKYFLDYPLGVFDIHAKTVCLDEDDREEAFELLWETLKIIFEPLDLDPYPGETRARDERNHRKLDQVVRDYWAEEKRMAAQRRRRGTIYIGDCTGI
ncbi:B3 domain-containing protein, partial [Striga asiatica]